MLQALQEVVKLWTQLESSWSKDRMHGENKTHCW